MKLKITCIYFLIIIIKQSLYAQTPNPGNANNVIIPPPPNVASLLKIADVPVSAYTGMASVTIPLYTIDEGDLKIPITMTYSSNGLKVTEEAGWIGLGWSLNAGGVIHQNVVGNPDDYLPSQEGYWPMPKNMPAVNNNDILENNRIEKGSIYLDNQYNQHTLSPNIITYGNNHEFDQYLYNFGAYSGKFILPNYPLSREVAMLDRNNIQITYSYGNTFTATTPDGTQYIFGTVGKTNTPNNTCNATMNLTSYSYYLTQIISPNGRIATFTYKKYTSYSLPSLSQSFGFTKVGGAGTFTASQGFVTDIGYAYPTGQNSISDVTSIGTSQQDNYILDNITTANTIVQFNTSPREDVDQGVKLDNISVYRTGETTPLKGFAFGYSYFQGDRSYGDWTNDPLVILSNCGTKSGISPTLISERLKLNTVQFLGNAGASEPPYQFLYDPTPLPYKTSLSQDLWGYFNGSSSHSLLPDYNNLSYFDSDIPVSLLQLGISKTLGLRNTVPQYLQAGILKKIINPTGGYTKISYEPNQFGNLPAQNNQIRDTTMSVTDSGVGKTQLEFDVPDIGYTTINPPNTSPASYNPALINVLLIKAATDNTGCTISPGYNAYNTNSPDNSNALYALLEIQDPVSKGWSFTVNNLFDANNPAINTTSGGSPCQGLNLAQLLVPGHYRITANFPDAQPGALPSPSAFISVSYKYIVTQPLPNFGGGLRVKSVTEYTDVNHPYNQKIYNYYGGRLMTKPIFYRTFLSPDADYRAYVLPNDPNTSSYTPCQVPCSGCVATSVKLPQYSVSLYSNPVLNYSYSASGAIVGYDKVTVDYSTNEEIGETSYNYNNSADLPYYYPDILPGEQGATNIFNGTLASTTYSKMGANGVLSPVKSESNAYGVTNFQDYWAYKSEYVQPFYSCNGTGGNGNNGALTPITNIDLNNNYLHFYPVKAGNVHIVYKTETSYDGVTPTTVTTNYQYNLANQVSNVSVSKSDGRNDIQQTFYPTDVSANYPVPPFITQMIAKNMIDYPIETIHSINSLTSTTGASYTEYYQHDNNIINPLNSYKFKLTAPFSITPFISTNSRDPNYELRESFSYDAFGNLTQATPTGGIGTNYLWGYNNTYPVAEINNSITTDFAYTSFEGSSSGNWSYSGTPVIDNTCPTGKYSYNLSGGAVTNTNMIASKTYTLSYWVNVNAPLNIAGTIAGSTVAIRSYNGWYFFRQNITGVTGITISGSSQIDELRLYPVDAHIKTFTYEPSVGISSATDEKGTTMIYEYDPLQNLQNVKDLNGNVIKNYAYNYAPAGTNISNHQLSQVFTKNNCGPGFAGAQVTYTVPAGKYISYISQADADDMAQDDINDYGQAYANANGGSCTLLPCQSPQISIVKNGTNGFTVTYTNSGGATSTVLIITDTTTGNVVSPVPITSPAGGVVNGTVPTVGDTYSFIMRGYGGNCPSGVMSNTVNVSF